MTTNAKLARMDKALVANQSPITVGTIFKGWRGSQGIDYMVTGINKIAKEIYAVKHNAVNQDGTIHASVSKHKRVLKYKETPSGSIGLLSGISSVLAQKSTINAAALDSFNKSVDTRISITDFNTIDIYAHTLKDFRTNSTWS